MEAALPASNHITFRAKMPARVVRVPNPRRGSSLRSGELRSMWSSSWLKKERCRDLIVRVLNSTPVCHVTVTGGRRWWLRLLKEDSEDGLVVLVYVGANTDFLTLHDEIHRIIAVEGVTVIDDHLVLVGSIHDDASSRLTMNKREICKLLHSSYRLVVEPP